tara:strand:+ start:419 stop:634 length:216 start_codon:yes stop_codon:yes gene_type:complete
LVVITLLVEVAVLQVQEVMEMSVEQVVMVEQEERVQLMELQHKEPVVVLVLLILTQRDLYQVVVELAVEIH